MILTSQSLKTHRNTTTTTSTTTTTTTTTITISTTTTTTTIMFLTRQSLKTHRTYRQYQSQDVLATILYHHQWPTPLSSTELDCIITLLIIL